MDVDWAVVAARAVGTTDSPAALAERFDVDEDDVEEMLSAEGAETCPGCGWWFWIESLDADFYCDDCVAASERGD